AVSDSPVYASVVASLTSRRDLNPKARLLRLKELHAAHPRLSDDRAVGHSPHGLDSPPHPEGPSEPSQIRDQRAAVRANHIRSPSCEEEQYHEKADTHITAQHPGPSPCG